MLVIHLTAARCYGRPVRPQFQESPCINLFQPALHPYSPCAVTALPLWRRMLWRCTCDAPVPQFAFTCTMSTRLLSRFSPLTLNIPPTTHFIHH